MNDNMDMDFGAVLDGEKTMEEMGEMVLAEIVKITGGKKQRRKFTASAIVKRSSGECVTMYKPLSINELVEG